MSIAGRVLATSKTHELKTLADHKREILRLFNLSLSDQIVFRRRYQPQTSTT